MSTFKIEDLDKGDEVLLHPDGGVQVQTLTAREQELLGKLLGCIRSPIDIDYPKLAAAMGMSNVRSASNAWHTLKKKLGNPDLMGTPAKEPKTPTPKTLRKRVAKTPAAAAGDDDDEDEDFGTPTKKRKTAASRGKAKGKAMAKKDAELEDDDHGSVDDQAPAEDDY